MITPHSQPARRVRVASRRGGFVFILVLVVMFIGAAMVTWGIERSTTEGIIAQRQAEGYSKHHLQLGIRDLVHFWLVREAGENKLDGYARDPDFAYRYQLPDRTVVIIRVYDGQGTIRARVKSSDPPELRDRLVEMLKLLPPDRPDLIRRDGPPQISINAAPPEVLYAVSGGNPDILQAIERLRDRKSTDRANIFQELMAAWFETERVQQLADMLQLDGNRLFLIEATVQSEQKSMRFVGYAEAARNAVTLIDWHEEALPTDSPDQSTSRTIPRTSRRTGGTNR